MFQGRLVIGTLLASLAGFMQPHRKEESGFEPVFCPQSPHSSHLFVFLSNFTYLFLVVLCRHCCRLPLAAVIGGYSLVVGCGLLIAVTSLVAEHGFHGTQISALAAPGLNSCGLASREICLARDLTCVSCIDRWILYH